MKRIVFFHPSNHFGGASILFCRLFQHGLMEHKDVHYIDCLDGYTSKQITSDRIIINSDLERIKRTVSNSVIICISTQLESLSKLCNDIGENPEVVVWVVHPLEFSLSFIRRGMRVARKIGFRAAKLFLYLQKSKMRRLKDIMSSSKSSSVVFMDSACINATGYFLEEECVNSSILPIPYMFSDLETISKLDSDKIQFAYFGRVEDFKLPPLLQLLEDLYKRSDIGARVVFHVIGDGAGLDEVKRKYSDKLELVFTGAMDNTSAKQYLAKNVDMLFAMGTAALDGASVGIPTILLNAAYTVKNQKYDWLYNTSGCCLGDYSDAPWFSRKGTDLAEIFEQYLSSPDKHAIQSKAYVEDNHAIDYVYSQLESYTELTKSNVSDFKI